MDRATASAWSSRTRTNLSCRTDRKNGRSIRLFCHVESDFLRDDDRSALALQILRDTAEYFLPSGGRNLVKVPNRTASISDIVSLCKHLPIDRCAKQDLERGRRSAIARSGGGAAPPLRLRRYNRPVPAHSGGRFPGYGKASRCAVQRWKPDARKPPLRRPASASHTLSGSRLPARSSGTRSRKKSGHRDCRFHQNPQISSKRC